MSDTDRPDIECGMYRPDEGVLWAVKLAFGKHQIRTFKTSYDTIVHLILGSNREPVLIQEESRTYLVLLTPAGKLLAYADPECKPGLGYLECDGGKTFTVWMPV